MLKKPKQNQIVQKVAQLKQLTIIKQPFNKVLAISMLLLSGCGGGSDSSQTISSNPSQTTGSNPSQTTTPNPSQTTSPNPSQTTGLNPSQTSNLNIAIESNEPDAPAQFVTPNQSISNYANYYLEGSPTKVASTVYDPINSNAKWTVMIYFAADNNLSNFAKNNIAEIAASQLPKQVNVVLQTEHPGSKSTQRAIYNKQTKQLDFIDMGVNVNMGSRQSLQDFVSWGKNAVKSDKQILIMWSHGLGWRSNPIKGALQDDSSNSFMSINDIGKAIEDAGGVDIAAFDSCLMGMYESAYALKDAAKMMVASSDNVPGTGFNYTDFLQNFHGYSESLATVGELFIASYLKKYQTAEHGYSVGLSSIDLTKINTFNQELRNFSDALSLNMGQEFEALREARRNTADFYDLGHMDLIGLLHQYQKQTKNSALKIQAENLKQLAKQFILKNKFFVPRLDTATYAQNTTGLAIYLPSYVQLNKDANLLKQYQSLNSQAISGNGAPWLTVVTSYTQKLKEQISNNQLKVEIAWDNKADIDLFIQEPSKSTLHFAGSSFTSIVQTDNGIFSKDSYLTDTPYESYTTKPSIEAGNYKVFLTHTSCSPLNSSNLRQPANVKVYVTLNEQARQLYGTYNLNCSDSANINLEDVSTIEQLGDGRVSNFRYVGVFKQ